MLEGELAALLLALLLPKIFMELILRIFLDMNQIEDEDIDDIDLGLSAIFPDNERSNTFFFSFSRRSSYLDDSKIVNEDMIIA